MPEERAQRRLAAILVADVVGYSRLMSADAEGTLAVLRARRRDILQPLVARHHGRVVKVMGDGVLVEFASAVNAVACAVELQASMENANLDVRGRYRCMDRWGHWSHRQCVERHLRLSDLRGRNNRAVVVLEATSVLAQLCWLRDRLGRGIDSREPNCIPSLGIERGGLRIGFSRIPWDHRIFAIGNGGSH